jgi:two-component system osmolarity sensor histidine kinase EnvZ
MLRYRLRHFLIPNGLLSRAILILFIPLLVVQIVLGYFFFDRHTDTILKTLSQTIAGDVALILEWFQKNPEDFTNLQKLSDHNLSFRIQWRKGERLDHLGRYRSSWLYEHLGTALDQKITYPYHLRISSQDIYIAVQFSKGVMFLETPRRRLFSRTTPLVFIFTTSSALVLFGVAVIFMNNQIRPLKRLARAANRFGKGDFQFNVPIQGAAEIRKLSSVFNEMAKRMHHHLQQRTEMLAGISHDLRTILTRFKLQIALFDSSIQSQLNPDILDMQKMLEGFLDYAGSRLPETRITTDLRTFLIKLVQSLSHLKVQIDIEAPEDLQVQLKLTEINRSLTNILLNSIRCSTQIWIQSMVHTHSQKKELMILIDDNGPGIPEEERENVFRPFYRLDQSRNLDCGGMGLGLAIARDGISSHGGHIKLRSSPHGGLKTIIQIPQ